MSVDNATGVETGAVKGPNDDTPVPAGEGESAERVFSFAIVVSAIRCTLTYVVFPFVAPFAGFADWGPWIGVIVGVIAIASNVISIRRMWAADHRWKKPVSVVNVAMIGLVVALVADDAISLLS